MQIMAKLTDRYENRRYNHTETVTDTTSDALALPSADRNAVAVSVSPGTSARVEYTLSSYAEIDAGTATWHAWDDGDVTVSATSEISARVSALRLVSTGASIWSVSA